MKNTLKRLISLLMMGIMMVCAAVPALASTALPSFSSSKPIKTYTYNSSGKVYAYTAKDLKTKTGGYISCSADECKIIEVSGSACKVTYPVSNGTKTAWFKVSDFTYRDLAKDKAKEKFTSKAKVTTYKWKGNSTTYGYVSKNDTVYLLRGDESSEWLQIIYPVSGGYKMAWVKIADYLSMRGKTIPPSPSTKSLAAVAAGEIGYQGTEANGSGVGDYTKYGKFTGENGQPWCASFVSWCVNQAGVSTKLVPKTAPCEKMRKDSSSFVNWSSSALSKINKNDVIFFSSTNGGESHHVGIVQSVSDSKITLIEGNTGSDTVKKNTYTVSNSSTGQIKNGKNEWKYFRGYIPVS